MQVENKGWPPLLVRHEGAPEEIAKLQVEAMELSVVTWSPLVEGSFSDLSKEWARGGPSSLVLCKGFRLWWFSKEV